MSHRMKLSGVFALVLCIVCVCAVAGQCKVVYVKTAGSDSGSGLSWVLAKRTVQAGLNAAVSGDEVWVAKGTYYERITLKSSVRLYGGFAGGEIALDQRNWNTNVCILDGSGAGTVVTSPPAATDSTRVDGFTIRNGRGQSGLTYDDLTGGGITCNSSSPTIANNVISGNTASSGGGIYCYCSWSCIANNTITGNTSAYDGGGIYCSQSDGTISGNTISGNSTYLGGGVYCWCSSPAIIDNTISGNSAYNGGGIGCDEFCGPTISRNAIRGNSASHFGGGIAFEYSYGKITNNFISDNDGEGIYCYEATGPSPTIANNVISGNNNGYYSGGGITCFSHSDPLIANNTIVSNIASGGGGIFCNSSSPWVENNIVAFNSAGGIDAFSSSLSLLNNDVYGNTSYNYDAGLSAGVGDVSVNPLFVNAAAGVYRLQSQSCCIDAGNDLVVRDEWMDADSQPRLAGSHVDIGAYEYQGEALKVTTGPPSSRETIRGPITYTITYTNAASVTLATSDVSLNRTGTANGVCSVSGSGTVSRMVTISNITGDGTLAISLAAGTAADGAGNEAPATGPSKTLTVTNSLPSVTIGMPSVSSTSFGPVSYTVTYANATSATTWPSASLQRTGTANGTVAVTGLGNTRTVTISNITGSGTLGISIAAGAASNIVGGSPAAGPSETFTVVSKQPVVAIGAPSTACTRSGPLFYTITYAGATSVTLSSANVKINKTGTAKASLYVSGSGTATRTVMLSGISGNGTLGLSIAAGTASNVAGEAPAAGPSATFTVDNTPPTVTIGAPSAALASRGPITYPITYAGADIVTLTNNNVTLSKTGTANGTVTVTGSGTTTRTVSISGISGDGTLGISLATATASDSAGNLAGTAGPSKTFAVDNTGPLVAIGAPSKTAARVGPITYKITYTGAKTVALTADDIELNATGTANGTVSVSGSGSSTRTVTISNITGDGTLGISLPAGTATDLAGNPAPIAGPSATFTVDNTAPTVAISAPSVTSTRNGPVTYTVTYTGADAVTLASSKVVLAKTGSAKGTVTVTGAGTQTRTVTISKITGTGTLGISISAGTASDAAGNSALAAGPSATFTATLAPPI